MAGGTGSDLLGLDGRTACVLFWRRTEKNLGAGRLADGHGAARGIGKKLFGVAREFVPPGTNRERQGQKVDRYCGLDGRTAGGGENVCSSDYRLRGTLEDTRGI